MSCDNFRGNVCAEFTNNRVVAVSEKRSRYELHNNSAKEICKIKVDGCLINNGARCDYLFLICNDEIAFFVELKGKNLKHAIEQLNNSIDTILPSIGSFKIHARVIVFSVTVPNVQNNPFVLKLRRKIKSLNGSFVFRSKVFSDNI